MNVLGDTMLQLDDDVYHAKIDHMQAWCKKKYGDRFKPKEQLDSSPGPSLEKAEDEEPLLKRSPVIQGEIKEARGFGKVRKKDKLVNNMIEINIQNKKAKNQKAKSP